MGAHTIAGGSNGSRGLSPPSPLTLTTDNNNNGTTLINILTGWGIQAPLTPTHFLALTSDLLCP